MTSTVFLLGEADAIGAIAQISWARMADAVWQRQARVTTGTKKRGNPECKRQAPHQQHNVLAVPARSGQHEAQVALVPLAIGWMPHCTALWLSWVLFIHRSEAVVWPRVPQSPTLGLSQ